MGVPLQQTKKWEKLQKDLKETTFFEKNEDYSFLAILKKTKFGNYLYLPYGPYIKTKKAAKNAYKAILSVAKQENVTFLRIEPQDAENASYWLKQKNCKKSHDLNPADTWVLDLTAEKSELLTGFAQGTRTRYNQFPKKGLWVTKTQDPEEIEHLVRLQHKLAHEKKIGTFSKEYLKSELAQDFATLYLVHYDPAKAKNATPETKSEDKIIAASLFFDDKDTRYYMQSAADMDYRKLPATVALLTTALFDAKEAGKKYFDFWGIAPEGAPKSHPWAGFTDFKKSFGGYEKKYAGTYDIVLKPAQYNLYKAARKTNRILRKILNKQEA